ncbi:MAG: NAD(P)/FAD-dependent oxidoreductase [Candidatus Bathyarchaeota archaeon]|nr:MAG: NAD(P)/FAD-dependent oxidoreductase [Candidatus Bathyarchaeota archaeon]
MAYVIIGASAGGVGAVEAIREADPSGQIIVITNEQPYSRPMISDFLADKTSQLNIYYRDDCFWEKHRVDLRTGRSVVQVNVEDKTVELDTGNVVRFEKLLIATGGRPVIPPIEGIDKAGIFTCNSLSEANFLSASIEEGDSAVVLGGGLIGVSVAEALNQRGLEVTLIELKNRILNLVVDEVASEIVENAMTTNGVQVITGETIRRLIGMKDDIRIGSVELTNGTQIPCDVLVIAIGVIPRIELVEGTPLRVNRGIVVDRFMQTSASDIYACGDVVETFDFLTKEHRLLPFWPLAHQGGRIAGYNMAGKPLSNSGGTMMTALKAFGVAIVSLGVNPSSDEEGYDVLTYHDPDRDIYKKIVLQDNTIQGIIFVTAIERAGLFFHLMKHQVNVKQFKHQLLSETFGLASLPSTIRHAIFQV